MFYYLLFDTLSKLHHEYFFLHQSSLIKFVFYFLIFRYLFRLNFNNYFNFISIGRYHLSFHHILWMCFNWLWNFSFYFNISECFNFLLFYYSLFDTLSKLYHGYLFLHRKQRLLYKMVVDSLLIQNAVYFLILDVFSIKDQ